MTATFNITQAFRTDIRSRQRVWSHDRSKTLGASETFACLRRGWFAKFMPEAALEMPLGMAERGNMIERHFVVPTLKRVFGEDKCLYMGDDQESFIHGKSSATPDGLIVDIPLDHFKEHGIDDLINPALTLEIKSFDPRANIHEEKTIHHGQAQMQMGMYHALTPYRPEWAMVLYVNANDLEDVRPFTLRRDPKIFDVGCKRAERLYAAQDPYELPAEGAFTDQCKHCPFQRVCRHAEVKHWPSDSRNQPPEVVEHFRGLVDDFVKYRDAEKDAYARKKEIEDTIKRSLSQVGTRALDDPTFKISYSKLDGKESIDKDALEAFLKEHGKTTEDFHRAGGEFTRLTVTPRTPNS